MVKFLIAVVLTIIMSGFVYLVGTLSSKFGHSPLVDYYISFTTIYIFTNVYQGLKGRL